MSRVYQWTDDEDEVAMDSVTVGISTDTRILKIGGLEFGQPKAWVYWPERMNGGRKVEARSEGPFHDITVALATADKVAKENGFPRVVLVLQDPALWDTRWGRLNPKRGLA